MRVKGVRWVGVETDRVTEFRRFAIDVLGLHVAGEDSADFVELAMDGGTKLEIFGAGNAGTVPWLFARQPVVAGFLVDDIETAVAELARADGVELLGDLNTTPDGYAWQHFRAPDGQVYEVTADPSA